MGELLVQFLAANAADAAVLRAETSRKTLLDEVAGEEKRIADVPGDYSVRNSLGVHYVQLGRNDDAREQFLAALELSPDHAVAHYNLGLIAILADRAEEAFTHLNRAIEVRPAYAEAHSNLGVLLEGTGRPDEAFEHYQKAIESRPDNAAARANLARQLMRRGRPDQAVDAPRAPAAASARESGRARQSRRCVRGEWPGQPRGQGGARRDAAGDCRQERPAGAAAGDHAARISSSRSRPAASQAACRRMAVCGCSPAVPLPSRWR